MKTLTHPQTAQEVFEKSREIKKSILAHPKAKRPDDFGISLDDIKTPEVRKLIRALERSNRKDLFVERRGRRLSLTVLVPDTP